MVEEGGNVVLIGSGTYGAEMLGILYGCDMIPIVLDGPEYPSERSPWNELAEAAHALIVVPGNNVPEENMKMLLDAFDDRGVPIGYFALDDQDATIDHVRTLKGDWIVFVMRAKDQDPRTVPTPQQFTSAAIPIFKRNIDFKQILHITVKSR